MTKLDEVIIRVAPRDDGLMILNEERPTGLFYLGPLSEGKELISDREWRITYEQIGMDEPRYLIEISYLSGFEAGLGSVAEWGTGKTEEEAWRYALGAALGGYDDPELKFERRP